MLRDTSFLLTILFLSAQALGQDFSYSVTAIDAETRQPIKNFRVVPTPYRANSQSVTWQSQYLKEFEKSPALFTLKRGWTETSLRVEAAGYKPAISEPLKRKTDGKLTVEMETDGGWSGRVLTPDGKPAAEAQVAVCTWTNEVTVESGQLRYGSHAKKLRPLVATDENGEFHIPSEIDTWVLVLAHNTGYIELTEKEFQDGTEIRLLRWGRLEGDFLLGAPPYGGFPINAGAGRGDVNVVLHYSNQTVETDNKGDFVFEMLPPVKMYVQPYVKHGDNRYNLFHFSGLIEIQSGDTTHISIPRIGQTAIGKVSLPEDCPHFLEELDIELSVALRPPRIIGFGRGSGDADQFEAYRKFMESDQSRPFRRDKISVDKDGSFQIPELPESIYVLRATAYLKGDPKETRTPYALASTRLTIPTKMDAQQVELNPLMLSIREKKAK